MQNFTKEDLNNIALLIAKSPITGNEAMTVAILQQKLQQALQSLSQPKSDPLAPTTEDKKTTESKKK